MPASSGDKGRGRGGRIPTGRDGTAEPAGCGIALPDCSCKIEIGF